MHNDPTLALAEQLITQASVTPEDGGCMDIIAQRLKAAGFSLEAINRGGLRLSGAADFTARLTATDDPKRLPRCDYGIVATKAIHTRAAIAQVARAFDENSAVCSVQNGVGNEEIIAEHVKYVIRGTTFPAGHPIEPGHIGYDIKGDTWVGPFEPTSTPMTMGSCPDSSTRK